jgi:uncharacterized protein YceH (UPF0502 family)
VEPAVSDPVPPASEPANPPPPPTWEPLAPLERRVLGVLIEKQKTGSGDTYPMSVNGVVTGCNQKSNRDPVMSLDEDEIEETLLELNRKVLVIRVQGGRVEKWRHLLYDLWKVSKVEMAVLAELLLRGPQTEGDLRSRASRMDDIPDLDTLRGLLRDLGRRHFVLYLTPPGRGAIVTHGFHTAAELSAERAKHGGPGESALLAPRAGADSARGASGALEAKLNDALAEIEKLKERVAALEAKGAVS